MSQPPSGDSSSPEEPSAPDARAPSPGDAETGPQSIPAPPPSAYPPPGYGPSGPPQGYPPPGYPSSGQGQGGYPPPPSEPPPGYQQGQSPSGPPPRTTGAAFWIGAGTFACVFTSTPSTYVLSSPSALRVTAEAVQHHVNDIIAREIARANEKLAAMEIPVPA